MVNILPLARVMSEQAELLERALLSLRSLELLVVSGETRFLAPAADEAEALLDRFCTLEVARAVAADALVADLGMIGSEPSLVEIVSALPPESGAVLSRIGAVLREQHESFTALGHGPAADVARERLDQLRAGGERLEAAAVGVGYGDVRPAVPALRFDSGA